MYYNNFYKLDTYLSKMDFENQLKEVNQSYENKLKEEEKVWGGFKDEREKLENIVGNAFGKVLKKICPIKIKGIKGNTRITSWNTLYRPQFKDFWIKITELETPEGILKDEEYCRGLCPHQYLEQVTGWEEKLHPEVKEFKKKYFVYYIENPNNNCEHK